MPSGTKIALKTIAIVFLLAVVLLATAILLDKDMNTAFHRMVDERMNDWVAGHALVRELKDEVATQKGQINKLSNERAALIDKLGQLNDELEQAALKVNNTRNELSTEFDRLKSELDREVASREIAIEQVREKFAVIRVGDKVLFDTGKSELKPRGREVLGLIADSLKKFPGREIRVEGHTDNLPIVSGAILRKYPTNWELSSARATAAVRYLIEQGGLDPKLLTAVGRAEHDPVASNNSPSGRASNRRIEIILMPPEDSFEVRNLDNIE